MTEKISTSSGVTAKEDTMDIFKDKHIVVRWCDGYKEVFYYNTFRAGCDYLWIELSDGTDRWIPNKSIRTFSVFPIDKIKN